MSTGRRASERKAVPSTLADAGVDTAGNVVLMGYDAPSRPPFRRHTEVAVEIVAMDED